MRVFFEPDDAKFTVFRCGEGMCLDQMPRELEGQWRERDSMSGRMSHYELGRAADWAGPATAYPTNRFEVREDGAIAQVWEVRW